MDKSVGGAGFWAGMYGGGSMTTDALEEVDVSKFKPKLPESNQLGALSAKHESGSKGSAAIGWDSTGGTSYGTYQLASRTGTFERFLRWVSTQGPIGQEVARRLRTAGGPFDTGSTRGAVPNEWRKLAIEGKLDGLEHEYIKISHYEPALRALSPEIQNIVEGSKALQDVLWSTAVQHGPAGAVKIFSRAFAETSKSGSFSPDVFIKEIYKRRGEKFPSSAPNVQASVRKRFREEATTAVAMLGREKLAGADATSPGSVDVSPAAAKAADTAPEPSVTSAPTETFVASSKPQTSTPATTPEVAPSAPQNAPMNSGSQSTAVSTVASVPRPSGDGESMNKLIAILGQVNTGIQQLVQGNTVLAEIRDGITSGFGEMITVASASSSDTMKKMPGYRPQAASMPRNSISVTRAKAGQA